jgi:hypothetical protein
MTPFVLPRKWRLHAHGSHNVFVKGAMESTEHVLMKIFLWALYLPHYPDLSVEIRIGDKYKPDVVSMSAPRFDGTREPRFWGESGQVSVRKIESLTRRYPNTHFAIAKWDFNLKPVSAIVQEALHGRKRSAPFDLLRIPPDSPQRFIDAEGNVTLGFDDIEWVRL